MSSKSRSTAFLLCYFLGLLGVHRFYLRRWPSGILMLLTLGGLAIWWMVDLILIAAGQLKDGNGEPLHVGAPDPDDPSAGFWVRVAAYSVDTLILNMGVSAVVTLLSFMLPVLLLGSVEDPAALEGFNLEYLALVAGGIGAAVVLLAVPLYFGLQTASRHQATVGKRCFQLKVTDMSGERIGFGRAFWRSLCYFLSSLILMLGFVMVAFTGKKRGLHDLLAGTRVVYAEAVAAGAPRTVEALPPEADPLPSAAEPIHPTLDQDGITPRHQPAAASLDEPSVARGGGAPVALIVLGALFLAGAAALAVLA